MNYRLYSNENGSYDLVRENGTFIRIVGNMAAKIRRLQLHRASLEEAISRVDTKLQNFCIKRLKKEPK